jgi:hypothetical protein
MTLAQTASTFARETLEEAKQRGIELLSTPRLYTRRPEANRYPVDDTATSLPDRVYIVESRVVGTLERAAKPSRTFTDTDLRKYAKNPSRTYLEHELALCLLAEKGVTL